MRFFNLIILWFLFMTSWSQTSLVINELEADSPSIDIKEFIEIKSVDSNMEAVPNFSINGYVLVFFNGSTNGADSSYLALDLSGYVTDSNGLLVIGNLNVNPSPQVLISDNTIQNGQDAVAIYEASINDFPEGTLATQLNLVDALVYGTNDAEDAGLLNLLGESIQYNDNGTNSNPKSIQRQSDGTYLADTPSPRALNDGSGLLFNTLEISTTATQFDEGESFTITFTAKETVTSDVNFSISLNNGVFTGADFSGLTNLTIRNGENSTSTVISLLEDMENEGDEELIINMLNLIEPVVAFNNLYTVRVIDKDFTVASWGTPKSPTYGQVTSTQPTDYYDNLIGKSGQDLRNAIQAIIADPLTVRTHSYADVTTILKEADQNPNNSSQVWLLYREEERSKLDFQNSSFSTGKWNREHTFPRSRGNFNNWDDFDDEATGINVFISTKADSTRHANSDAHALRAADASENSRRSNANYSNNFSTSSGLREYNGPANVDPINGIGVSFRGDVARSVLFLDLRYNGLSVVSGFPNSNNSSDDGTLGNLDVLLQWHEDDIPDDYEMNRNNVVYNWQRNRNPLIDLPDLVDYIWGSRQGEEWMGALGASENQQKDITFYPNPANNKLTFIGLHSDAKVEVFSIEGRKISDLDLDANFSSELNLSSGIYLLKVKQNDATMTKRLVVK